MYNLNKRGTLIKKLYLILTTNNQRLPQRVVSDNVALQMPHRNRKAIPTAETASLKPVVFLKTCIPEMFSMVLSSYPSWSILPGSRHERHRHSVLLCGSWPVPLAVCQQASG